MMRSLYSGISGLRNHQTRMDVIGNNIANVNTAGYKTSRVVFQDIYSQNLRGASAGGTNIGGTNPMQIGLGVTLAAIDVLHNPAATQITDNPTDLAMEGDGFFVIQGSTVPVDDGSGNITYEHELLYTRAGNFYVDNAGNLVTSGGNFVLGYAMGHDDTTGLYFPVADPADPTSGDALDFTDQAAVKGALTNINLQDKTGIYFDQDGVVWCIEGEERVALFQVSIGMFTNNGGLEKRGESFYAVTGNSGGAKFTIASNDGAGKVKPGALEMSNVDLASEFTDMIVTQRGFQANSRIITTSDTLLEELVNLKR
ncbi:MAG: flagellar hook-basal body complex protein [Clostridiales bacterium]|nr:flagellar hook-basal body complex protein [Clostridiales bacterium]